MNVVRGQWLEHVAPSIVVNEAIESDVGGRI